MCERDGFAECENIMNLMFEMTFEFKAGGICVHFFRATCEAIERWMPVEGVVGEAFGT